LAYKLSPMRQSRHLLIFPLSAFISLCVCLSVCPCKNPETLIRNWCNLIGIYVTVLLQATRFWWCLILTFDLERNLSLTWKLLVIFWCNFILSNKSGHIWPSPLTFKAIFELFQYFVTSEMAARRLGCPRTHGLLCN